MIREIHMQNMRRSMLMAAGAGLASLGIARAAERTPLTREPAAIGEDVKKLVQLAFDSNAALMLGDVDRYRALVPLSQDFMLMSPFGGKPSHARDITEQTWEAMKSFFRNGTFQQELIQAYASQDMVVLATIERTRCEVGGLPPQDWALRVTLVFSRAGDQWKLAHRHADPLVGGITLEQAAALAREHVVMSG
jgi:ketosteroid isomerase-like protein